MNRNTHMNASCHIGMRHGTHTKELCHEYEQVVRQMRICHASRRNESWHTYEGAMPQIDMSHGTHVNVSCRTGMGLGISTKE